MRPQTPSHERRTNLHWLCPRESRAITAKEQVQHFPRPPSLEDSLVPLKGTRVGWIVKKRLANTSRSTVGVTCLVRAIMRCTPPRSRLGCQQRCNEQIRGRWGQADRNTYYIQSRVELVDQHMLLTTQQRDPCLNSNKIRFKVCDRSRIPTHSDNVQSGYDTKEQTPEKI